MEPDSPILERASRTANRAAEWAMAFLLAALACLVGAQIAGRFALGYSLFWSDELARFLLVWIAFLGMSVGVRRGAHPGVGSLLQALPPRTAAWAALAGRLLALAFFLLLVGYGGLLVLRTWPQRSPSLGLRMSLPYLAVPVAGLLMALHAAAGRRPARPPAEGPDG